MASHISMLTATDARSHVHLVIGANPLAAARCGQSLSAGASPILIAPETAADLHFALQKRIEDGEVKRIGRAFEESDLFTLGRDEVDRVVDAVFVTSGPREPLSARISALCRRSRIPVNVVDAPHLCTFALLSTHADGPLQVGVTTNGRGCKLASRIRREIAAALPPNLGSACARLGDARRRIIEEDHHLCQQQQQQQQEIVESSVSSVYGGDDHDLVDDSVDHQSANFNKLVTEEDRDAAKTRRMRWLAQVCEYWPLKRLAAVTDEDVDAVLKSYASHASSSVVESTTGLPPPTNHTNGIAPPPPPPPASLPRGRIILAGSGPGHPDLLTRATYKAIQAADLVLADKLVPAGVLDLIPRRTPVQIARKFPGNADAAQDELHEQAATAASSGGGRTVLRLKQGDPYVYGRGGEEVAYFRARGFTGPDQVVVLPGVTSALSAPLFAAIPPTQRDVADQVLVCTGTGKKGRAPAPPEYVASRTVVFLMALHRIAGLVAELTTYGPEDAADADMTETTTAERRGARTRALWPLTTPCAVIERASCPDQRVIRTTLGRVVEAIAQEGSRPPGLLVVGRACEFLNPPPLDKTRAWVVEEGFRGLDFLDSSSGGALGDLGDNDGGGGGDGVAADGDGAAL
ncbi:uroporphyrin-III C-methyltransferase [Diatrype stigma]|uniref:Uroporphyrin-III C-methyltransferase n=1 Tax=Diatrype stigma TaxID=117547 RepID=A0AAN9UL32_9PEZI